MPACIQPPNFLPPPLSTPNQHIYTGMCAIPLGVAMRLLPVKEDPDNYGGQQGLENVEPEEPKPHGHRYGFS